MRKTLYGTIALAFVLASGAAIRANSPSHHELSQLTAIDVSHVQSTIDIGSLPDQRLAPEVYQ